MSDATITLAQISDVHLGPLPHIPLRLLNLKRLTGFLNWHRKRRFMHLPALSARLSADVVAQHPDHIAVTGDLANIGLPSEIERGAEWLTRLGTPSTVSIIPGNHDIYSTIGGRNLGAAALTPWQPYFASDVDGAKIAGNAEPFPFVRVLGRGAFRVALIGLNSAVETPPAIATGRLGPDQLHRLARILDATRQAAMVRVVMIHHPPIPGMATPRHELTDASALAEALRKHGAELVIHGHNHRFSIATFQWDEGTCAIVGAPSASMAIQTNHSEDMARAHIFEIAPGATSRTPAITLVARGPAVAGGPIVELLRQPL